jgi:hypothetical protein
MADGRFIVKELVLLNVKNRIVARHEFVNEWQVVRRETDGPAVI